MAFPWVSGAFTARTDLRTLTTSDHCSAGFLNHLRNFEQHALLQATSVHGKHYRHLLRLEYTEGPNPELRPKADRNRNPQEWSELCSVISAYKLADVVALLETESSTPPIRMEKRTKAGPARLLPSYVRLADWTKPLDKLKLLVQSKSEVYVSPGAENVQIKLLKSVFQCSQDSDKNRVASNLFAASLHLSYLLNNQFGEHELPELTRSLQDLTKIQISCPQAGEQGLEHLELTTAEISFWKETLANEEVSTAATESSTSIKEASAATKEASAATKGLPGYERQPLQVALAISPLYLLVPTRMLHNSFGKENILRTAIALGNQRPSALISVEKAIWRLLFGLAIGKIEPEGALITLMESIPWSEIETCTAEEREWFKLAGTKGRAIKPNSLMHNTVCGLPASTSPLALGYSGLLLESGRHSTRDPQLPTIVENSVALSTATQCPPNCHSTRPTSIDLSATTGGVLSATSQPIESIGIRPKIQGLDSGRSASLNPTPFAIYPGAMLPPTLVFSPGDCAESLGVVRPEGFSDNVDLMLDSGDSALVATSTSSITYSSTSLGNFPRPPSVTGNDAHYMEVGVDGKWTPSISSKVCGPAVKGAVLCGEVDDEEMADHRNTKSHGGVRAVTGKIDTHIGCKPVCSSLTGLLGFDAVAMTIRDDQEEVGGNNIGKNDETASARYSRATSAPGRAVSHLDGVHSQEIDGDEEMKDDKEAEDEEEMEDSEGEVDTAETNEKTGTLRPSRLVTADKFQQGSSRHRAKTNKFIIGALPTSNSSQRIGRVTSASSSRSRKRKRSNTVSPNAKFKQRKVEAPNCATQVGQGTKDNPISVEEYCLLAVKGFERAMPATSTLEPLLFSPAFRYTVKDPLIVYDGRPQPDKHAIWPSIHDKQELTKLVRLVRSTKGSDVDSKPLHVTRPKQSQFRTFDYDEYSRLKPKDVENILKTHCIVVTGMPWSDMEFDKDGLRTLAPLNAVVPIQGEKPREEARNVTYTIVQVIDLSQPQPENNFSECVVQGTIEQMLMSAKSSGAGDRRKALNGLSFPFNVADQEQTSFAACRVAWSNTSRTVFTLDTRMPASHINWGLGATEGACTFWHLDSDGLATTVDIKTGSKLWIVGSDDPVKFSRVGFLLSNGFELDQVPQDFKTEAILLTAKTRLIMRPGVVHAVYTPQDTICHGTHFYSTGSMQATLVSLIHGFICHKYITNTSHPETRVLLRRILHFYHRGLVQRIPLTDAELGHVPQIAVPHGEQAPNDEVLNFLSACILAFFANVLDPRTYTRPGTDDHERTSDLQPHLVASYNANNIPLEEREEICETRGACMDAFAWFRTCFEGRKEGATAPVDVVSTYLVQLARTILRYKYAAEINGISATGGCRLTDLERQLENAIRLDRLSWDCWVSLYQGKWLDEEMAIQDNVEVGNGGQEASDHEDEDQNQDMRIEGICVNVSDRQPQPSKSHRTLHWQDETLLLDEHHLYQFLRNDKAYTQSTVKWMDLGSTVFDSEFRRAVSSWRAGVEARGVRLRLESEDFAL